MQNSKIGIIEGFFGPEWSWDSRRTVVEFLHSNQSDFYLYAPKRDSYLRRNWKEDHPSEVTAQLQKLSAACREKKIEFGVGLSPFEIHNDWNEKTRQTLREKILKLEDLGIDSLGLFFDDMRGSRDLAEKQCEIVEFTKSVTDKHLLFCPTYYSYDPILERVFGTKPEFYLETLGEQIAAGVEILWTGSKVIPAVITAQELEDIARILKRKPFIWENCFANDGPKQCKFLKLKPFTGRSAEAFNAASGWAFNLMNQPALSMIAYQSSLLNLRMKMEPRAAYEKALQDLAGVEVSKTILKFEKAFMETGLDQIEESRRTEIQSGLNHQNLMAQDISDWLSGKYIVGSECLTD